MIILIIITRGLWVVITAASYRIEKAMAARGAKNSRYELQLPTSLSLPSSPAPVVAAAVLVVAEPVVVAFVVATPIAGVGARLLGARHPPGHLGLGLLVYREGIGQAPGSAAQIWPGRFCQRQIYRGGHRADKAEHENHGEHASNT